MSLSLTTFRRLAVTVALAASVAAVTAPATFANHRDVGVSTALEQVRGERSTPDAIDRYFANHPQARTGVECDAICRYANNHRTAGLTLRSDTLGGTGGAPLHAASSSDGRSWPAVALGGAGATGALILLITGTLLLLKRRRNVAA